MAKSKTPKSIPDTAAEAPETTAKQSKPATSSKAAASKSTDSKSTDSKPARSKSTAAKKPAAQSRAKKSAEPSQEDIARRAYEIHQERGGTHGRHEDDWRQAEEELRGKGKKTRSSK